MRPPRADKLLVVSAHLCQVGHKCFALKHLRGEECASMPCASLIPTQRAFALEGGCSAGAATIPHPPRLELVLRHPAGCQHCRNSLEPRWYTAVPAAAPLQGAKHTVHNAALSQRINQLVAKPFLRLGQA